MKKGIRFMLPVKFDLDVNTIEKCDFIFEQDGYTKRFTYPSEKATLLDDAIGLLWEPEDTAPFRTNKVISMDTRVSISGSNLNPQTNIVTLTLSSTLFEEV